MKRSLLIVLPLLLIVGCSQKPVDETTLIEKDGVMYLPNSDKPYTGEVFTNYMGGNKKLEGTYKDGNLDGLYTEWWGDRQKMSERFYKDGKKDGLSTQWYRHGLKKEERTFKNGKQDGLETSWYYNGQKKEERTYKDGKKMD